MKARAVAVALGAPLATLAAALSLAGCPPPTPRKPKDFFERHPPPPALPTPRVPDDNPMTDEKVELGHHLFYEKRLSVNGTTSCGTCHIQVKGFTDGRVRARGATGDLTEHNAMSLTNVAYNVANTWSNPAQGTLEKQMDIPMFSEHPVELGLSGIDADIVSALRDDDTYAQLFTAAFPDERDPFTTTNVKKAIASFERTLLSGDTPYDRYFNDHDDAALSDDAKRGLTLFFSEKCECYHCHGDFNLADTSTSTTDAFPVAAVYHNTGLYNVDGAGAYPAGDRGLIDFTDDDGDMGKFRATSLRNIDLTAPYMHDGSMATLDSVLVDQYAHAGRAIADGEDNAGDGSQNPLKDPLVKGFTLDDDEKNGLLAFLSSLTDESFVANPDFGPAFDCPDDGAPSCPATPPSYAADVAPILEKSCVYCHTADGAAAAEPLDTRQGAIDQHDNMLADVAACTMPADGKLAPDERTTLLAWIACGEPE